MSRKFRTNLIESFTFLIRFIIKSREKCSLYQMIDSKVFLTVVPSFVKRKTQPGLSSSLYSQLLGKMSQED